MQHAIVIFSSRVHHLIGISMMAIPPNRNSLPDPASFFRESCAEGEAEAARRCAVPRRRHSTFTGKVSSFARNRRTDRRRRREGWGGDWAPTLFEVTFHMRFIGENISPTVFVCTSKIAIIKIYSKPKNFQNCNAGWTKESEDGHPERD